MIARSSTTLFLLTLSACASWREHTEDPNPTAVHALDRSYVFVSVPTSGLTFEAWLAPHLPFWQNLQERADSLLSAEPGTRVWARSLSATPMVRLRMYNEVSNPVRTPSYMPRGQVQAFRMRNLSTSPDERLRNRGPIEVVTLTGMVGHHSNGQDGCLFADEIRDGDGECQAPGNPPSEHGTEGPVNKTNGSFSTNYLRAGVDYERMRLENNRSKRQAKVGGFVEWHPVGFLKAGAIDENLHALYGPLRVEGHMEFVRSDWQFCGAARALASALWIHDGPPDVPAVALTLEAACVFRRTGWGIFVRGYRGQDYYNLGFLESIARLQVGVTWDQERFLHFEMGVD